MSSNTRDCIPQSFLHIEDERSISNVGMMVVIRIIKISLPWSAYYGIPSPALTLYNTLQCNLHIYSSQKSYEANPIVSTILQMRTQRQKVKYLFMVTSGREFVPRPFVSRSDLLGPYIILPLLVKKEEEKKGKEGAGRRGKRRKKKRRSRRRRRRRRAHDTCVYLGEPNGIFECCLRIQLRLN